MGDEEDAGAGPRGAPELQIVFNSGGVGRGSQGGADQHISDNKEILFDSCGNAIILQDNPTFTKLGRATLKKDFRTKFYAEAVAEAGPTAHVMPNPGTWKKVKNANEKRRAARKKNPEQAWYVTSSDEGEPTERTVKAADGVEQPPEEVSKDLLQ